MSRFAALLTLFLALLSLPVGAAEDPCQAPDDLVLVNYPDNRVYEKIHQRAALSILVLGSSSSVTAPAWIGRGFQAYPRRLERELAARLPGIRITVTDRTAAAQTAATMAGQMERLVLQTKPDLVIWETGTTDAVHKVDLARFGEAVGAGLRVLREHEIDILLVDMQFSPQTEAIYDFQPYLDYLAQLAEANDANLLNRYALMRYYIEEGRFDPAAGNADAQLKAAGFVHGCLARHLASMILTAAQQTEP